MSFPDFASLPPELIIRVLSGLDTPRDLLAVITSSRYVYQVFQGNQIAVLTAVIRTAMLDDNIYTAVAACKAARVSKLGWANSPAAMVAKAQDDFFDEYPRGRVPADCSLNDRSLLLSLYKLWWTLDYFLARFQQDAFKVAAQNLPLIQNRRDREMTKDESSRLQRAFLRFEIYRRLTPNHLRKTDSSNEAYDQTLAFIECFPPWEREEILSVQEFLVEVAKDIVRSCEDHVVHEISSVAREMAAKSAALQQTFKPMSIKSLEMALDLSSLDVFRHNDYLTERRFQYLVGRGLPFMKWLSNLSPNSKLDCVLRLSFEKCRPTLLDLLVSDHREITSYDAEVGWSVKQHMGRLRHPNHGWLWAEAYDLTVGEKPLLERYTLRRAGYVFWNAARLRDDWRLQEIVPSTLALAPRSSDDDDNDWREEAGIEERFKDIAIPEDSFRLREDKSDVYSRLEPSDEWRDRLCGTYPMPIPFSEKEAEIFGIEY